MNNRRAIVVVGCMLLAPLLLGLLASRTARPVAAAPSTTLVINEIYNSNTGTSPNPAANEYVELYNISANPIDLSNYSLYNKTGRDSLSGVFANPIIQPGEFRAIPANALPGGNIGGGNIVSGIDIGLASDSDYVGLAFSGPSDIPIDAVYWGSLNPGWFGYAIFQSEYPSDGPIAPLLPADNARTYQRYPDGRDTNRAGDFALLLSSPGSASCEDPYEDDDTQATARTYAVNGSSQLHRICGVGDEDWYKISMSALVTYSISAIPTGTGLVLTMRLYDASGNLVATGVPTPDGQGSTIAAFRPTTSGDYSVQVTGSTGVAGANGLYNFSATASAAATFTATPSGTTPTATPNNRCSDAYEPDNDITLAKVIVLNSEQSHVMCPANDRDWVTANVGAGKVYHFYTKDLAGPLDTVIRLRNSSGQVLAVNDDAAPGLGRGLGSQIDYTFSTDQQVYLEVYDKTFNGDVGYSYTLGFSVDPGPLSPTPTRSPTTTPTPAPTMVPCLDIYEGDGAPANASLILINDAPQHRSFCPNGDADWIRFFAGRGKAYTIRTLNPNNGPPSAGVDPYTYLFDSDGTTVIAQNDDGNDGVNSRIDFFPSRDDYYYVQVKNKGDIGGNMQLYDIQITVQAGVPPIPSSPTAVIAPIVTTTVPPTAAPPTAVPPTAAPPTAVPPTAVPTTAVLPTDTPVVAATPTVAGGAQATAIPVVPPTNTPVVPAGIPTDTPVAQVPPPEDLSPTPEPPVNLPPTGGDGRPVAVVSVPITVYVDNNRNGRYDAGEGVRDLGLIFREADGTTAATTRTDRGGASAVTLLRGVLQRLSIPYLGRVFNLTPSGAPVLLRFPAPHLPTRIP